MEERLRQLKVVLFDVDGILTDGRIIFDNNGIETKAFDVKDGHGMKLLQRAGFRLGIITGRQSEVTVWRARELGIDIVFQGVKDKLEPYLQLLRTLGITDAEVGYMGDDLVDLPVLRRAGFAATVADAVEEIKPHVHYVTSRCGGRGAVREVCDLILRGSGKWSLATDRYFAGA
jgi:3-deoxy-D-manno-octulosonate 8-phosphate phosphatase (KDO 8-P phosphatase)